MARQSLDQALETKSEPTNFQRATHFCMVGAAEDVAALVKSSPALLREKDAFGMSLLHCAAQTGQSEVIQVLVKAGVDVNIQSKNLDTPLHLAAYKGHCDAIKLLLELNASQDVENKDGKTASELVRADDARALLPAATTTIVMAADLEESDDDDDEEW